MSLKIKVMKSWQKSIAILALIFFISLIIGALLLYGLYNGYQLSSLSEEWSKFGSYLAGISGAATFITAIVTATIILKQSREQKEIHNFDRLIKHRALFFEAIDSFTSSHENISLPNRNKVYDNFFPNNRISQLSLFLEPRENSKLEWILKIIKSDDKELSEPIKNPMHVLKELVDINYFLGIQRKESVSGDVIWHGSNYGLNIFEINKTYKLCSEYIENLEKFFNSKQIKPERVTFYTKSQLDTIIKSIAAKDKSHEDVYIFTDDTLHGKVVKLYLFLLKRPKQDYHTLNVACEKYIKGIRDNKSLTYKKECLSGIHSILRDNRNQHLGDSNINDIADDTFKKLNDNKDNFLTPLINSWDKILHGPST